MKVLLLEDVNNLGLAGSVVNVPNGFGRNYLIPQKLAKIASEGAQKEADIIRRSGERKRARNLASAQVLAEKIQNLTLTFKARAGETGKLYGSITTADLATALEEQIGEEIDRRKIISDPLRQLGEHEVEIRLMTDVAPTIKVIVEPEQAQEGLVTAEMDVVEEVDAEESEVEITVEEEEEPAEE